MTKQGQCSSLGAGRPMLARGGVSLWIMCVCMYTFSCVSLLYMPVPQGDYVCVDVFQMCTCAGDKRERVHTIRSLITTRPRDLFPSTSNSPSLYVFHFIPRPLPPLWCVSPDPGFAFSPESKLRLRAVTFEQKQLRTSHRSIKKTLSFFLPFSPPSIYVQF